MRIEQVKPQKNGRLYVISEDGRTGVFDVRPYLKSEAFKPLRNWREFSRIRNGGYFIEWRCGADLSADTIEARWQPKEGNKAQPMGAANSGSAGAPPE